MNERGLSPMVAQQRKDDRLDLLEGVGQIARFLGVKPRRVFYLAENNELPQNQKLPLFKIGNRWCARRSTLVEHIEKLERGEAAA